jgi:hypothetical protein
MGKRKRKKKAIKIASSALAVLAAIFVGAGLLGNKWRRESEERMRARTRTSSHEPRTG